MDFLLNNLNIVDYIVLAVIALSGMMATTRGLMREILGVMGWIIALLVGTLAQPFLIDGIEDWLENESAASIIGFVAPFLIAAVFWYLVANLIAPGLRNITFSWLDGMLGFVFGMLRGVVLVTLVYILALLAYENEDSLPQLAQDSASIETTRSLANVFVGFASGDLRRDLSRKIPGRVPQPQGTLKPDETIPTPQLNR